MKTDEFAQFFGMRKPRSTRKNVKEVKDEIETKYIFDEYRFCNGFLKIFNHKINPYLLERFYISHDITELYFILDNNLIRNNIYLNYFSCLKDYEEISKNFLNIEIFLF